MDLTKYYETSMLKSESLILIKNSCTSFCDSPPIACIARFCEYTLVENENVPCTLEIMRCTLGTFAYLYGTCVRLTSVLLCTLTSCW